MTQQRLTDVVSDPLDYADPADTADAADAAGAVVGQPNEMHGDTRPSVECGFTHLHGTPVFVSNALGYHSLDVKRIFGATHLRREGLWVFPAFYPYIEDVLADFRVVFREVLFTRDAQAQIARTSAEAVAATQLHPDFRFHTQPFQHQTDGLLFALRHLRCGLFYDMGLGKSKIAIDLIRHEKKTTLILSPLIGVKMWVHEILRHSAPGELAAFAVAGTWARKLDIVQAATEFAARAPTVLIVGYDTAKQHVDTFLKFPYEIIIADESHYLRTNKSDRTKAMKALSARAARRLILSGTPSLGNPMHLYGQMAFLAPYAPAKDMWAFRKMFTLSAKSDPHIIVGYKNLDMLNLRVRRICTRRTKEECLDLPERTIIDIPFELEKEQKTMYNRLVATAATELANGQVYEAPHAAAVLQKLLQILSGFFLVPPPVICDGCENLKRCVELQIKPYTRSCAKEQHLPPQVIQRFPTNPKLDVLEGMLDSILAEPRNKCIIWCHFTEELNAVAARLAAKGIRFVRVDGSNSQHAQAIASDFNASVETRIYLAQVATGVALTLTSANYTIYYGMTYELDSYLQSMDRNYRIGQKVPVFVYRLIAPHSVLDFVAQVLAQKIDITHTLTDTINCALCPSGVSCVSSGQKPFSDGCVYQSRVKRIVTKPVEL